MLGRFHLYEQRTLYKNIDPERGVEVHAIELDVDGTLSYDSVAQSLQLSGQEHLVDAFEQAWAKLTMQPYSGVEHVTGNAIDIGHGLSAPLRLCANPKLP